MKMIRTNIPHIRRLNGVWTLCYNEMCKSQDIEKAMDWLNVHQKKLNLSYNERRHG